MSQNLLSAVKINNVPGLIHTNRPTHTEREREKERTTMRNVPTVVMVVPPAAIVVVDVVVVVVVCIHKTKVKQTAKCWMSRIWLRRR